MTAEEWAEKIVAGREWYTDSCSVISAEDRWQQQVAYTTGFVVALDMAGAIARTDLCNALNKYAGRIPEPV